MGARGDWLSHHEAGRADIGSSRLANLAAMLMSTYVSLAKQWIQSDLAAALGCFNRDRVDNISIATDSRYNHRSSLKSARLISGTDDS